VVSEFGGDGFDTGILFVFWTTDVIVFFVVSVLPSLPVMILVIVIVVEDVVVTTV
jgi:hypothetical protein